MNKNEILAKIEEGKSMYNSYAWRVFDILEYVADEIGNSDILENFLKSEDLRTFQNDNPEYKKERNAIAFEDYVYIFDSETGDLRNVESNDFLKAFEFLENVAKKLPDDFESEND